MVRIDREPEGVFVPTILDVLANVNQLSIAEQACGGTVSSDIGRARVRRQRGCGQGIVTLHVNRGLGTGDS